MFNFFLCGFMGCGKSTLARLISQSLPLKLIDTDVEIEKQFNMSIPKFFTQLGEQQFRIAETNIIKKIITQKNTITATGGATLILNGNANLLTNNCKVIFIDTSFHICFNRIKNSSRPILNKYKPAELQQLFLKRKNQYLNIANKTISEQTNLKVEKKLEKALTIIKKFN